MILAVIESDYGTLHLVDKLTLEDKEAALEITIDGNRSICSLSIRLIHRNFLKDYYAKNKR